MNPLKSALLAAAFLAYGLASACAFTIAPPPAADAMVTKVNCAFNGPNCVSGKYPDMAKELQAEANMGLDVPSCQGDCNQFGFIPDAAKKAAKPATAAAPKVAAKAH